MPEKHCGNQMLSHFLGMAPFIFSLVHLHACFCPSNLVTNGLRSTLMYFSSSSGFFFSQFMLLFVELSTSRLSDTEDVLVILPTKLYSPIYLAISVHPYDCSFASLSAYRRVCAVPPAPANLSVCLPVCASIHWSPWLVNQPIAARRKR